MPELALPGIGGIFESRRDDGRALPLDEPLDGARLSNEALLGAVRALSLVNRAAAAPGAGWTSATWARRNSAACTSRCWS